MGNSHLFKFNMFPVFILLLLGCSLLPTTLSNPEPVPEPQFNGMGGSFLAGVWAGAMQGIRACGQMEAGPPRGNGQIPSWDIRLLNGMRASGPPRGGPQLPSYDIRLWGAEHLQTIGKQLESY